MKPQMVASVDQGSSPLELVDEETEEMRLIGIVETLDTSLGDDAAAVRLRPSVIYVSEWSSLYGEGGE